GMLWMIGFDEAERKGMAVRVPIAPGTVANGIESLFVLGVGAPPQPAEISRTLMRLLAAHHYPDGLEFLRAGTPTNNTAEGRAGYSTADPGHQPTFALDAVVAIEALTHARY